MIDTSKPVQTREGKPVRILATDLKRADGRCIVVAINNGRAEQLLGVYPDGRHSAVNDCPADIINTPDE